MRISVRLSCFFFFSSRRRHTRYWRDWSSDVCSSDLLHQTFAKRAVAHNHGTVEILQRSRKDFGSRRRGAAYQYCNRDVRIQRFAQRFVCVACLFDLPFRRDDGLAAGQKEIDYLHRLIQQSSAIGAQVDYKRSRPLFLQIQKRLFKIFGRIAGEGAQVDIPHIPFHHRSIRYRRSLNSLSHDFEFHRRTSAFLVGALHLQFKARTDLSPQHLAHLGVVFAGEVFSIDLHQDISRFQSGFCCRSALERFGNHRTFQLRIVSNQRPYTSKAAFYHLLQFALVFFREILRIRVEREKHIVDSLPNGFIRIDRIHVEHVQLLHYRIEDIQILSYPEHSVVAAFEAEKGDNGHYSRNSSNDPYIQQFFHIFSLK